MHLTGINAIIALTIIKKIPYKNLLYPSIVMGIFLPEIDIIISFLINNLKINTSIRFLENTYTHSLFTIIGIYLSILIFTEIKKIKFNSNIAQGIVIGLILHIFIDIFIKLKNVHVLWPLPIGYIHLSPFFSMPDELVKILMPFEFLCFRLYGWILIKRSIDYRISLNFFLKYISWWMKGESILFILFLTIFQQLEIKLFNYIFIIAYIPSLIMAMLSTYFMYKSINFNFNKSLK